MSGKKNSDGGRGMVRRLAAHCGIVAAMLLAAPLATTATAQQAVTERFEDWVLSCVPNATAEACSILQDVSGENGQRAMAAEIRLADDGRALAILLLPFGLSLEDGVVTRIGDGPASNAMPLRTCLPNGCVATFPIDGELLARMRAGTEMGVEMASVSGEPLRYNLSLFGFTAALNALAARGG